MLQLPGIHGIIDHRVNTTVCHSQPVKSKEHMWGVPGFHDGGIIVGVEEVRVIG